MNAPVIDLEEEKKLILKEYRSLLRSLRKNVSAAEKKMVREAFELAMESHKDMRRKSGEPYVLHPIAVAKIVAEEMGLDLVEITPNAVPPVVRIVDYNKFLYQKKKREKELKANSSKVELKEIRFGPETGDHDFDFKLRHAKSFLAEGNKVKAYVQFRGRAIVFKDRGELLLLRFMKELEDYGVADQMPKLEGKRMGVILSPKKTGGGGAPKKKEEV